MPTSKAAASNDHQRCENAAWEKARFGAPGLGG